MAKTTYVLESETGAILDEHLPAYCYAEVAQREANERGETIYAYAIDPKLDREDQSDKPCAKFEPEEDE